ncbi:ABC-three component system protein [Acinetobacter pittii]|uniref:ABC-three component system protein n=1 Tax=Acinetobacter pittii TaxID=48296 RepID=UPI0021CD761B|nr:ABC-three component system protein [Acinetobacter pittii]MCU4709989.1 hypothetical protein [Acinetobacter pittii]
MINNELDEFSASSSSLGYEYQIRYALLKALESEMEDLIFIETLDDIEIKNNGSQRFLSLKHKKEGNYLTDLSVDFWKSMNIWLKRYQDSEKGTFYLITTENISPTSFLINFSHENKKNIDQKLIEEIEIKLNTSKNPIIKNVFEEFKKLSIIEKKDLLSRITIINSSQRITEIPNRIKKTYLTAAQINRIDDIYERLEGWWYNKVIEGMANNWKDLITKKIVILKINKINEEYFSDSLPLLYSDFEMEETDIEKHLEEDYIFVSKVRDINLKKRQISKCIIDFYKATNERNEWIKKTLISAEEINKFEKTLIDEWERFKDNIYDEDITIPHEDLIEIGKKIFHWAQESNFNIKTKVTEKYISRGTFHIIADDIKERIYWLPK